MSLKQTIALIFLPFFAITTPLQAQEALKPVKLISAEAGMPELTRQFFGQVVARQTVDLAFQVGGQLVNFPVIEGAFVDKDDLVAELDLEPFMLSLEQAQLQKDQAERTLNRLKQLSSISTSQVNIDDATTQLSLAEVSLKNAEYALKHATLSAPFDALVAAREVANFTTIGAGTPVVRLHDMSEVRVEVDVPEVLFLSQAAEDALKIQARFPSSDRLFPLELREYNAETTKVGQSFRVTLGMSPPAGIRILPGASVTVIMTQMGSDEGGVLLPKQAVFIDENGEAAVMAFNPKDAAEGTLSKIPVVVAPAPNKGQLIVSGLEAGTEVVAAGGAALKDGQSVRRFTGFGN